MEHGADALLVGEIYWMETTQRLLPTVNYIQKPVSPDTTTHCPIFRQALGLDVLAADYNVLVPCFSKDDKPDSDL